MRFPFIFLKAVYVDRKIEDVLSILHTPPPPPFFFHFQKYFLEAGKCLLFPESMEIMICVCAPLPVRSAKGFLPLLG